MMKEYLPEVMDSDEQIVVDSFIESLTYLKKEAVREGQDFIAYAIEDALIQAKGVRKNKYIQPIAHNMQII